MRIESQTFYLNAFLWIMGRSWLTPLKNSVMYPACDTIQKWFMGRMRLEPFITVSWRSSNYARAVIGKWFWFDKCCSLLNLLMLQNESYYPTQWPLNMPWKCSISQILPGSSSYKCLAWFVEQPFSPKNDTLDFFHTCMVCQGRLKHGTMYARVAVKSWSRRYLAQHSEKKI